MVTRSFILFFALISPAWASVSVQYIAQDTMIWEVKSGKITLHIQSPNTSYNDHTGRMLFSRPTGLIFDEQNKHHRFQAEQGVFWPGTRNLNLSQNVMVHAQDGTLLRSQFVRVRHEPLRLELTGNVRFEQPPNPETNSTQLTLESRRGVVYPNSKRAKFEGACRTQFTKENPFLVQSSSTEIIDLNREIRFDGGTILTHHELNARATTLGIFFQKLPQQQNAINLEAFQFFGHSQLKFNPKNGDPYHITGENISLHLSSDQHVENIEATEKVKVAFSDGYGLSDKFNYDLPSNLLTFTGHPARFLLQKESFNGQEILYNSKTKIIEVARAEIEYQDKQARDEPKKSNNPF